MQRLRVLVNNSYKPLLCPLCSALGKFFFVVGLKFVVVNRLYRDRIITANSRCLILLE